MKNENNNSKNSTRLSNYNRNVLIEDDKIMVSFGVTSCKRTFLYVDKDDQFTRKMANSQDKFLDLVDLLLTTPWHTFGFQFY